MDKFVVHGCVSEKKVVGGRECVRKASTGETPEFWSVYSVNEHGEENWVSNGDHKTFEEANHHKMELEQRHQN